ncbi:MAG: hypothetical protein MUD09_00800 [Desulfobacterales bacterium]|nr:hypothetical protein [Desulfobacterales bacterium]
MKELETFLQNVAEGLRSLAGMVDTLACKSGQLDKLNPAGCEDPKNAEAARGKSNKGYKRRKIIRTEKATTAAETIYHVIKSKKAGIDTSDLIKETDFEDKKVRNIIYKLKKQNRIKTAKRGVYVAS